MLFVVTVKNESAVTSLFFSARIEHMIAIPLRLRRILVQVLFEILHVGSHLFIVVCTEEGRAFATVNLWLANETNNKC